MVNVSQIYESNSQGCGVVRSPSFFGWSRIPSNTRSRIFCPTPQVQVDHFFHHTPKLGILVEMVQFLLLKWYKRFCCNRDRLLCTTISIEG